MYTTNPPSGPAASLGLVISFTNRTRRLWATSQGRWPTAKNLLRMTKVLRDNKSPVLCETAHLLLNFLFLHVARRAIERCLLLARSIVSCPY